MDPRDERDSHLVSNDPAHTASREAAERARRGEPPAPRVGGTSDTTAAAIGGAAGAAAAGAAAGTFIFGPVGTIIGALAGALGGWWAGEGVAKAGESIEQRDEARYREHYESLQPAERPADLPYEHARNAYLLGHLARRNPEYAGRPFEAVEPDLRRGWNQDLGARYGEWEGMRGYVRAAYQGEPIDTTGLRDPLPESENRRLGLGEGLEPGR
ncbi:MAG TPA: hypothetical protein VFS44_03750 [Gemmatimonadaceae bacterium]|nr:hypothetical protein [Gemmatimonadaceae bacterium]